MLLFRELGGMHRFREELNVIPELPHSTSNEYLFED